MQDGGDNQYMHIIVHVHFVGVLKIQRMAVIHLIPCAIHDYWHIYQHMSLYRVLYEVNMD